MDVTEYFCKVGSISHLDERKTANDGAIKYDVVYKEIVNFDRNYNGLLDMFKSYINQRTIKSSQEYTSIYIYIYIYIYI